MDTMRNKEWETIWKGYIYRGPSSLTFSEPLKPSKPFSYARYNNFSSIKSGRGRFYHILEKSWYSHLEQKQAWFSSLRVTKGSQRNLSHLMSLPGQWGADRQCLHKFPDPGNSGISRWSQKLSLGLDFHSSLTDVTALASSLWHYCHSRQSFDPTLPPKPSFKYSSYFPGSLFKKDAAPIQHV